MGFFSRRIDRELAAYQRELIDTHYQEVENMYRQIRGWRHDYRNHIQVMKALAANGDLAGIQAYLDELDTDLNTVDTVIKTGNAMADAILNSKISLAKSRQIPVQADAHIPVKLRMSELDLCVILGNLFDNAIEASLALPEDQRLIRVYMDMKGTQLYISFTNFTAPPANSTRARAAVCHHQGSRTRLRAGAHRQHHRPPGRLSEPQQRGRSLHHRDPDSSGMMQFVPQNLQFVPGMHRGPFVMLG